MINIKDIKVGDMFHMPSNSFESEYDIVLSISDDNDRVTVYETAHKSIRNFGTGYLHEYMHFAAKVDQNNETS